MKSIGFFILRILGFAAFPLLALSLIIALCSLATPAVTVSEVTDNRIGFTTTVQYDALMKRSILYPLGGVARPEGQLIAKIASAMVFTVETAVAADAPVDVDLTGRCRVKIISEGLWERDFDSSGLQAVRQSTADASLYSGTIAVNLARLDQYIEKIEEETGVAQERYIISLVPEIRGTVQYQGKSFPVDPGPAVKFSYLGGLIQPLVETNSDVQPDTAFPRATTQTHVVTHTATTVNTLWGTGIPIATARMISIPAALLLGFCLGCRPAARLLVSRCGMSPATQINRKHRHRIIQAMERPEPVGKAVVELPAFQELMRLADQKELPILCHDGGEGFTVYFLIDPGAVYCCKAANTPSAAPRGALLRWLAGRGGAVDAA